MNDVQLECVSEEKDLGVIISGDLKWEKECSEAVKKANRMLGMIKRIFIDRSKEIIISLYKSLVKPHLEYCCQIWSPYYKKDIKLIEGVQRRATKLVTGSFFSGRSPAYSGLQHVGHQQAQCTCPWGTGGELVGVCSRACLDQLVIAIRSFTLLCDHSRSKTRLITIMSLTDKPRIIYATACHASLCTTALDCLSVSCHCHRTALTNTPRGGEVGISESVAAAGLCKVLC